MRHLIALVLILCSGTAFAASGSGNISNIFTVGGGTAAGAANTNTTGNVALSSISGSATYTVSSSLGNGGAGVSGHYYSFGKMSGVSAQWKVPSGKIAVCTQIYYNATATGNYELQFGYATATFSNDTGTAPTGANCYSPNGNCTNTQDGGIHLNVGTANIGNTGNYVIVFDASSTGANADIYPFFRMNTTLAGTISMTCFQN